MTNYDNSVIYKICCKDEAITDVYVGSTTNAKNRKYQHKSVCNNKDSEQYNRHVYRYIRDHGDWDNWEFVLLEKFPCKDRQELVIRERYWYEMLGAKLNTIYPQKSKQEYDKEYRSKPEVKERQKEYHRTIEQKTKKKEYLSRPEVKERKKEYLSRPEVKERVKEYKEKTYTCLPCNKVLKIGSKMAHEKSKKHLQNLEKQEIEDSEDE
jgi:hypothetical protein